MRKSLLLVLAAFPLSLAATAQQATWFEAEGSHYFLASGYQPGSTVAWYEKPWGGRELSTGTANATGELRLRAGSNFNPAFAISSPEKGGNGHVCHLGAAEFSLSEVRSNMAGGIVSITWKATVATSAPIVFEVLCADKVIATLKPSQYGAQEVYTFSERAEVNAIYNLRVRNTSAGERYKTRPYSGAPALSVYPTIVKDMITISGLAVNEGYNILSPDGQVVLSGRGDGTTQQLVSLGTLPAGVYMVSITGNRTVRMTKVVKE